MVQQKSVSWWVVAVCLLGWASAGQAQTSGPNDPCRNLVANEQGIASADILVSTTPVTILAAQGTRVEATVLNTSPSQAARCMMSGQGVPSATAGFFMPAGAALSFTLEGQKALLCVRDTTATADLAMSTWSCTP
jgi:hypothetical protein